MKVTMEVRVPSIDVSAELRTGERVHLEGVGYVTAVVDDIINITAHCGPRQEVPGERSVSVLLQRAALRPAVLSEPEPQ